MIIMIILIPYYGKIHSVCLSPSVGELITFGSGPSNDIILHISRYNKGVCISVLSTDDD